ncbi:MAG: hypothetical protein Q7K65_05065 [Candidatus Buchananbacteria bacterium]|nr:hypothetical protein [Candidatus Buchananbacteria bacterium]
MPNKSPAKDVDGHKKTYILTFDLSSKLKLLRTVGLKVPDAKDAIFTEIKNDLTSMVKSCFTDVSVIAVNMEDLSEEILSRAMEHGSSLKDAMVVSTCLEISSLKRGQAIEINRLIDRSGKIIGLGPRPGHGPLESQIQSIAAICRDRSVILMEDGTFTGGTLLQILGMFKEHRINVAAVVLGFAFEAALKNLDRQFNGDVFVVEKLGKFIDWMPDHDFFPFVPNCGRVIGIPWNGCSLPFYTHNGASYSVPYILPFCPMTKWTSIPEDKALSFSKYCLERDLEIFRELERLNGRRLIIGDLMNIYPRVSIPITVGQKHLPHLDASITEFLSDLCHEVS